MAGCSIAYKPLPLDVSRWEKVPNVSVTSCLLTVGMVMKCKEKVTTRVDSSEPVGFMINMADGLLTGRHGSSWSSSLSLTDPQLRQVGAVKMKDAAHREDGTDCS